MQTKVLLLEDDDFTRVSVEAALKSAGMSVIASSNKAAEAIQLAEVTKPNVAVLDLHLGVGPTGIDVARVLRRSDPGIGIVLLTSYEDPRLLSATLGQPPSGSRYVLKKDIKSIENLVIEIGMALKRIPKKAQPENSSMHDLTDNQIETLRLVAQGLSNAEIARRKEVSEKSIEAILNRVAKSLNLQNDKNQNQRVNIARVYFSAMGNKSAEI